MKKNPSLIKDAIIEMGGRIEEILPERGCFYIIYENKRILVTRKFSISRSPISNGRVSKFKDLTYLLLQEHGLPTPKSVCLYKSSFNLQNAEKALKGLKYPVVVKDAQGSNSKGVFTNIANIEDALVIVQREFKNYSKLIVQEMIFGKEYRLLVLGDKVIGALEMIPPRITGDGISTVQELIERKQDATEKRTPINKALVEILNEQGVTLESVIENGKIINIKKNSALAEGGETKDFTNKINVNVEKICVEASKVMGKYLVGIDVICEDISLDPAEQVFSILELNAKPDLYIHYNPTHGDTKNVVKEIVQFMVGLV